MRGEHTGFCSVCKKATYTNDEIFIDTIDLITHQRCFDAESYLRIKLNLHTKVKVI